MQRRVRVEFAALVIAAAGTFLQSTPAHATPVLQIRCATDSLNPAIARLRLEWARACGLAVNVVSPTNPKPPSFAYQVGINSTNGLPLWEYIETDDFWGKNSYSGDVGAVNQVFTQMQWRVGAYTATTAAGGFQKWTESPSLLLSRPSYPTYGNAADINVATQLFPNPNYSLLDCKLYTDAAGTHPANTSVTGFYVNGFCTSTDIGCADGTNEQTFSSGMVGCGGSTTYANRSGLCAIGYRPATAAEWVTNHGATAPTHDYWTNDALKWNGAQNACFVSTTAGDSCIGGAPMHVCTATGTDAEGNTCNWTHCGNNANTPDQFFGGCVNNAGTLCVPGS